MAIGLTKQEDDDVNVTAKPTMTFSNISLMRVWMESVDDELMYLWLETLEERFRLAIPTCKQAETIELVDEFFDRLQELMNE